jgi:hypothetical protein
MREVPRHRPREQPKTTPPQWSAPAEISPVWPVPVISRWDRGVREPTASTTDADAAVRAARGMESDDTPDEPRDFEPDYEEPFPATPADQRDGIYPTDPRPPGLGEPPWEISDDLPETDRETRMELERPDVTDQPLPTFEELRWVAEATFTSEAWRAELDHHREVTALLTRVDNLITRLAELPLVPDREGLAERLHELSSSDLGECLREIGRALERLAPATARVVLPADPQTWVDLLERSIAELAERGAPSIVVLPAPDGRLNGRMPSRAVSEVEIRDSKAVMFGSDATLTVVHHCEVERPVIEIAALIDHPDAGPCWGWWSFAPSSGPMRARAADGMETRIVSCSGVSTGDGNVQETVIGHRMTSCPVDLAVLLSHDAIRAALVRCRDDTLDPVERIEAREQLRRIVTRVVALTDASALLPDEAIARQTSETTDRPTVRSRGASLTVMHGVGVAVGWRPTVAGHLSTKVGRFHIR